VINSVKLVLMVSLISISAIGMKRTHEESPIANTDEQVYSLLSALDEGLNESPICSFADLTLDELLALDWTSNIEQSEDVWGQDEEHGAGDFVPEPPLIVETFKCPSDNCGETFEQKIDLAKHVKELHPKEKCHKCLYCDKSFVKKYDLTTHIKTHDKDKPYKCNYEGCESKFSRTDSLETHMRKHTGEKPYACSHKGCDKKFSTKSNCNEHVRSHGETDFKCISDGCNRAFATKNALTQHMIVHSTDKRFTCDFPDCKYASNRKGDLAKHKKNHSNKRPFRCDYPNCGYATKIKGDLAKHKKTHGKTAS